MGLFHHNHDHDTYNDAPSPISPDTGHLHLETRRPVEKKKKRLLYAILITAVIMILEVAGGLLVNSLALLSDAAHMFTHVFALGISYFAILISARPADMEKTFGYFRVEVLVAFINGMILLAVTVLIFYESALRMINPEPVKGIEMLMVALVGLVANGASFLLLARVSRHDINLKSAFMHVVFDTASSVAVVASAIVIEFTGFMLLDPIVSSGIGVLILVWCINLIRDSVNILLEATPRDVDIRDLSREVEEIAHVKHIHDIHVWQITSNMYVMTAHVVLDDLHLSETQHIIEKINRVLQQRHRIGHTTLQVEVDSDSGRVEMAPRENIKDGPTRNNGTSH